MRRQWIALILVAAAVAAAIFAASRACNDDGGGGGPVVSGTPSPVPEIISEATSERDGLVLTLKVDSESYDVDDGVPARAVIKNTRPDAVTYQPVTPTEAAFRMVALSTVPLGTAVLLPGDGGPPAEGTLGPGKELELEVEWDQQLDLEQTPIQAPPGKYSIRATFVAIIQGVAEPEPVRVAVTFRLEGSEPVLLPLDVLGRAVATDELQAWMEGRAENVICASPSTAFFYQGFMPAMSAAETFDFLYATQREAGLPICGIGTDGDNWRLNFFSLTGPAPNRLNMLFDLNTGELTGVEEPTPPPSASPSAAP